MGAFGLRYGFNVFDVILLCNPDLLMTGPNHKRNVMVCWGTVKRHIGFTV